MNLHHLIIFKDNYIWIVSNERNRCVIVDPGGDTHDLLLYLKKNACYLEGILLTHNHEDHIGGVKSLLNDFPSTPVYGPSECKMFRNFSCVRENDEISLLGRKFFVLDTPGHTAKHISIFDGTHLFCGDTLFSGGCGRVLEDNYDTLYDSLQKICRLPEKTLLCCGHEYTLENMIFANTVLPNDIKIICYLHQVKASYRKRLPTLPITLKKELSINPFLRIKEFSKRKILNQSPKKVFRWLRIRKNNFSFNTY